MRKILFILLLFIGLLTTAQNKKATLYFKDNTTKTGIASIEGAYKKIVKFRTKKGAKIEYYNYESIKYFTIEHYSGTKRYTYRKKKKKRPELIMINSKGEENGTIRIHLKDGKVVKGMSELFINPNTSFYKVKIKSNDKSFKVSYKDVDYIDIVKNGEDLKYKYVYKNLKKKPLLLEVFAEGAICLYGTRRYIEKVGAAIIGPIIIPLRLKRNADIHMDYYICKKGEFIVTKFSKGMNSKTKKVKQKNIEYFNDCPELVNKINNNEFLFKDIIDIVEYYNTKCN